MKFKKGDRILFNRLRFGNVYQDQTDPAVVHVTLDRERSIIQSVRSDAVELVADAAHEANLAASINAAWTPVGTVAGEGLKKDHAAELMDLAAELSKVAYNEKSDYRLRLVMDNVADKLRSISEDL